MKKLISLILILTMLFSIVSCNDSKVPGASTPSGNNTPHTHAFGEWQTVKAPNCQETGIEERVCECGESEENPLSRTDHVYVPVVTEPTCTEGGYTTYTCACGKSRKDDRTEQKGHDFGDWYFINEPTCTGDGTERRDCKNCSLSVTRDVDEKGHDFGDWYFTQAPTCFGSGMQRRDCKNCSVYQSAVVDSYGGHSMGDWYGDGVGAPTCTNDGFERRDCQNGDCTEHETRTAAAKGHSYTLSTSANGEKVYTCFCGVSYIAEDISLVKDGKATLSVVIPNNNVTKLLYARDKLVNGVRMLTNVSLSTAYTADSGYVLLLGDTDALESKVLKAKLSEDQFAIKVEGKKLIVVASDDVYLYDAIEYLLENCLISDGSTGLRVDQNTDVIVNADTTSNYVKLLSGTNKMYLSVTAHCTITNKYYYEDPQIHARQGGCFNGNSYYQLFKTVDDKLALVSKLDLATGEVIYSEVRTDMGHGNDITYNENTNQIYVCNGSKMIIFNADTLKHIKTITAPRAASGLEYCPERDCFIFHSSEKFYKVSSDLSTSLGLIFSTSHDYVTQGIGADETFVYYLLCKGIGSSKYSTYVHVYDWYGNLVREITVNIPGNYEPENISAVNGEIYIGTCTPHPTVTLYKLNFK